MNYIRAFGRIAFLSAASMSLSACELQRAQEAADAQKSMVGLSKAQVLSCMGAPESAAKADNTEVWSYNSGNGRTDTFGRSFGSASIFGNGHFASGFGSSFGSATSTSRYCKVDIVMDGGNVTRVNYHGPTGGLITSGEQCAFAISACLGDATSMRTVSADSVASPVPADSIPSAAGAASETEGQPESQMQSFSNWKSAGDGQHKQAARVHGTATISGVAN